ncbi:phospholipase D-like domain-containing protein [Halogeometricum sp. S1BR25-6]|uniref:Phospholipase D-like domain-containing protein n=1 Tax=Halogeometricum salsisoli TaxID=2950536 RepID=A0ABU2GD26_9EURY|nr:phospholipase D-like domain-containing protein [Halogeometricum sp. S1BR25-6]MDS0298371.1 phospholipase D-like domain-containing protein [Halogeometricum sp. S1BR25-6]
MLTTRRLARVLLVCALLWQSVGAGVGFAAAAGGDGGGGPTVVGGVPNPVVADDAGEYVAVRVAGAANLTLSDGEDTVPVPRRAGVVALAADPDAAAAVTALPVVRADLSLSNAGERLVLRRDGAVVDEVEYGSAPEGERWNASADRWTPVGLDLRDPVATGPADATAFVLPDAPGVAVETLRSADERLLLAGYTLSSDRVADALLAAYRRGVRVHVLVEGSPVGGVSRAQAATLDRLVAAGVPVAVVSGPRATFSYQHAKYAVADDRAVVLTENWKPAGTGGRDSRGWGVRVDSGRTADELAAVFAADSTGRGVVSWPSFREGREFVDDAPATTRYPARIPSESVRATEVRVLTAPGNAGEATIERVDGAEERIAVVNPRIDPEGRFFAALVRAARRGVSVRLLLSNAWYDEAENEAVVARADELRESGLPIEARIADPRGRFGKVHAKGAVVDGEVALVGSLNWNDHAATENREVVLELRGEEPAGYFRRAFDADWEAAGGGGFGRGLGFGADGAGRTTWLLVAGALASAVLAGLILKKTVRFERE